MPIPTPLSTSIACSSSLLIPSNTFSYKPQRRRRLVVASVSGDNGATKPEYTPWLIAGLGNPGNKYHGTRHNVGFEMIDQIARAEKITMNTIQSKALIGIGSIGEVPILLVKPQSYMNYSGEAVGPLAAYYKVPLRHILLVYDEMSLPNAVLRLQQKGGHGHHNGEPPYLSEDSAREAVERRPFRSLQELAKPYSCYRVKSVIEHLDGCRAFPRLCIGIGNPPGTMDLRAFLLQKFSSIERAQVDNALEQGVDAVRTLVLKGFSGGIDQFNLVQKYKYHKV